MVPDVATCKYTTKIQTCSLQYVLRGVGILLTLGILEHSPLVQSSMKTETIDYIILLLSSSTCKKPRFIVITVAKNIQYHFGGPSKFGGPGLPSFSGMLTRT